MKFVFPIATRGTFFDGCLVAAGAIQVLGQSDDVFDGNPETVTLLHFDDLEDFKNLNAFQVISLFSHLTGWLGNFSGSEKLGFKFPFANLSLGDLFKFDLGFLSKLNLSFGSLDFFSYQGLFDKLSNISGVDVSASFSPPNTLFDRIGFGGPGAMGILTDGDSTNNTIRRSTIQNVDTAIRVDGAQPNLIENNSSSGSGGTGIYLSAPATAVVRGNDVHGREVGIYAESKLALLYDNRVHDNTVGITAHGAVIGPPNPAPFGTPGGSPPNDVYANKTGILVPGGSAGAIIRHNKVHGSTVVGIEALASDSRIVANDVHENAIGVRGVDIMGPASWESKEHNLIHHNDVGAWANPGAEVRYNIFYNNAIAIHAAGGLVHHNLIYDNSDMGVLANSYDDVAVMHNTIYATTGNAVRIENVTGHVTVQNNILYTVSGTALYVGANSQFRYTSDYNNLFTTNGTVAFQGKYFSDLYDWQVEAAQDLHSIGYTRLVPTLDDPQVADLPARDFHLLSGSTSIDAGHPASSFGLEPVQNGNRANLGAFGNTPQATESPPAYLKMPGPPTFYQDLEPNLAHSIVWETYNVIGDLAIELWQEGVGKVADVTTVPAADGTTTWTPQDFGITSSITTKRDSTFLIQPPPRP